MATVEDWDDYESAGFTRWREVWIHVVDLDLGVETTVWDNATFVLLPRGTLPSARDDLVCPPRSEDIGGDGDRDDHCVHGHQCHDTSEKNGCRWVGSRAMWPSGRPRRWCDPCQRGAELEVPRDRDETWNPPLESCLCLELGPGALLRGEGRPITAAVACWLSTVVSRGSRRRGRATEMDFSGRASGRWRC